MVVCNFPSHGGDDNRSSGIIKQKAVKRVHIEEERLTEFFEAIEMALYTSDPVYPENFFTKREFRKIARCDICTLAVLTTFNLAGEYMDICEFLEMLRIILVVNKVCYKSIGERERSLVYC